MKSPCFTSISSDISAEAARLGRRPWLPSLRSADDAPGCAGAGHRHGADVSEVRQSGAGGAAIDRFGIEKDIYIYLGAP